MNKKIVGSAVSLILVVGVVIGVVAVVQNGNGDQKSNNGGGGGGGNGGVNTHSKAVSTLCQPAEDQKLCHDVLNPVNTSDPKDYVAAVVKHSMESVIKAFNMTDRLTVEHGNKSPGIKMALEDCKDLMQSAIHELEASGVMIQESNNIQNITERAADLKNWLGAVFAYQQSCLEGFNTDGEKQVQTQLQSSSLDNVAKLTGLALDVVSGIAQALSAFDLNLILKPASRRLLTNEVDHEGYPTWFSASDRKLLAKAGKGKKNKAGGAGGVGPNAIVAKDGSGQFKTVLDAINSYPKNHQGKFVIYVKAGIYNEHILIDKKMPNIIMYGDGPTKTIITGRLNFKEGVKTMHTATFAVHAPDFMAKSIAFENTAGHEGHQAVALRVQGDRAVFFDCAIHGYQDSLYAQAHRQFYRNCEISGTVDFIFGMGTVLIQNSRILVRKPGPNQQNIITADGTAQQSLPTGIVIQRCEIMPAPELAADRLTVKTYLARPWKAYSRAVFIENVIGDLIQPEGYIPWNSPPNTEHAYFAEFGNTGPGADTKARVKWGKGLITKAEAARFTAEKWIDFPPSKWIAASGVPFDASFTKA